MRSRPTSMPGGVRLDWDIIRRLLPYVGAYGLRSALAVGLLLVAKGATVATPMVLKEIVDALDVGDADMRLLLPTGLLLGYGALKLASTLFRELQKVTFARVRYGIMRELSRKVVDHLYSLSLRYHLERKTGSITRDLNRGTRSISNLLNYLIFNIVPTLVEIAMIAIILVTSYGVWFMVVAVVTFMIYVGFTLLFTEWRLRFRVEMNDADSKANSRAIDGLLNYETVKIFGQEDYEIDGYDRALGEWEAAALKSQWTLAALNIGQNALIAGGVTAMMFLAADGVVEGEMSIGDLVAVNAYLLQLFIPLGFLGTVYSILKHALTDMERMFELLDEPIEVRDAEDAAPIDIERGAVRFEGVSFRYEEDRPILHDIDLEIPSGHKVAVVGPSGAGKSTLGRLLMRFYDVDEGRVLVDDQDVRHVTQQSLRRAVGVVPQDTVLFNETLAYNIGYGDEEATAEQIAEAAHTANLAEFVDRLPDRFETLVGERGLKLSGGEKQRVAIARAILTEPKVLIFDEATSSLDSASERAILDALREVARGHTTLVIAHRLSTIVDADQIVVMEEGRIVERGTHGELLERAGAYARLWRMQQEDPQADEAGRDAEP